MVFCFDEKSNPLPPLDVACCGKCDDGDDRKNRNQCDIIFNEVALIPWSPISEVLGGGVFPWSTETTKFSSWSCNIVEVDSIELHLFHMKIIRYNYLINY